MKKELTFAHTSATIYPSPNDLYHTQRVYFTTNYLAKTNHTSPKYRVLGNTILPHAWKAEGWK